MGFFFFQCPDVPCCFPGYKCRLAGLSKYNPAFSKFSEVYNKTWMCLSQGKFNIIYLIFLNIKIFMFSKKIL